MTVTGSGWSSCDVSACEDINTSYAVPNNSNCYWTGDSPSGQTYSISCANWGGGLWNGQSLPAGPYWSVVIDVFGGVYTIQGMVPVTSTCPSGTASVVSDDCGCSDGSIVLS